MTFPTRSRLSLPRATGDKRTRRRASTGFHTLARFCRCLRASCEASLLPKILFQAHVTGSVLLLAPAERPLEPLPPPPPSRVERGLCSCGFTRWKPRARNLILPGPAHLISHISSCYVCVERRHFHSAGILHYFTGEKKCLSQLCFCHGKSSQHCWARPKKKRKKKWGLLNAKIERRGGNGKFVPSPHCHKK